MEKKTYLAGILIISLSDNDEENIGGPPLESLYNPSIVIYDGDDPLQCDYVKMLHQTVEVLNANVIGIVEIKPEFVFDVMSSIKDQFIDIYGLNNVIHKWSVSNTWHMLTRNDFQSKWLIDKIKPKKYEKFDLHDFNLVYRQPNTKPIGGS